MTMPPILFRGLEMAKKGVSIAFLSSAGPKFGSKNVVYSPLKIGTKIRKYGSDPLPPDMNFLIFNYKEIRFSN